VETRVCVGRGREASRIRKISQILHTQIQIFHEPKEFEVIVIMAPQIDDRILRAVNFRIKNTLIKQLPRVLSHITAQLVAAKCDLSNNGSEAIWLKARISSLLQDRSQESRFCGVVLVKTVLDLGGSNAVVQDKERTGAWIRGLLDVLKRPGPVTTKKLAIVAITKTFMLTWGNATLVRELTTPSLPAFITTCLQHFQGSPQIRTLLQGQLVEFVLESFAQLLPRHPTVFRSFAAQIRSLAVAALCNDPFDSETAVLSTPKTKDAACQILVLLHQCAQKGGGAAEWEKDLDELLTTTHATLDQVFRVVTEDWQSVAGVRSTTITAEDLPDEPHMASDAQSGFPDWSGLRSGVERLQSLLALLEAYIYTPTAAPVKMPLGRIIDLLTRLLYVQAPRSRDAFGNRYNAQISRDEREELLALLPSMHVSTLKVTDALLDRLETAALPICLHFLDLLTWLFLAEQSDADVRMATYTCVARLLSITGPTLGKSSIKSLDVIIRSCCKDLLPVYSAAPKTTELINAPIMNGSKSNGSKGSNGLSPPTTTTPILITTTSPDLHDAAHDLLPTLYHKVATSLISKATRTEMDRTAVLTNHTEALAASVLNPAPHRASLLPFLSAIAPGSAVAEAIFRPRMPVILGGKVEGGGDTVDEEDEVEGRDGEDEEVAIEAAELREEQDAEPKTMDWATVAVAKQETEKTQLSWAMGDITSPASRGDTQHLSAVADPRESTTKRRAENNAANGEIKRLRVDQEEGYKTDDMEVGEDIISRIERDHRQDATAQVVEEEESDEDDEDFEIPALVMRTDFGEDDEDEEEE
jgi:pre-rRNA-processing protein RIX1